MEDNGIALDYNTSRERLAMPEYGRNVLKMVEQLKAIPDKAKRTEQARALIESRPDLEGYLITADTVWMSDGFAERARGTYFPQK